MRLSPVIPVAATLLWFTACQADDPRPIPPSPLELVACGLPVKPLGAGAGITAALCRPGVDPSGVPAAGTIALEHDGLERLERLRLTDEGEILRYDAALDWDSSGRLAGWVEDVDGDGRVDRLTQVEHTPDGAPSDLLIENPEGTPLRLVRIDYRDALPSQRTIHDGMDTLLSIEDYDWAEGRMRGRTLKDGTGTPTELATYDFDPDGHLSRRSVRDGLDRFLSETRWTWMDGRLQDRTDLASDGSSVIGEASYAYDSEGRLDTEWRTGDAPRTLTYLRDNAGNLEQVLITSP